MPEAPVHDTISISVGIPLVAASALLLPLGLALSLVLAYAFSCYMLSPDLDLVSEPYQRWGWFRWVWTLYMKFVPHRSWISHAPIFGTLIRVCYLLAIPVALLASSASILPYLATITDVQFLQEWSETYNLSALVKLGKEHWQFFTAVGAGLEAGALVHIIADTTVSFFKKLVRMLSPRRK